MGEAGDWFTEITCRGRFGPETGLDVCGRVAITQEAAATTNATVATALTGLSHLSSPA